MAALQHTDGRITASWCSPVPAPFAATAAVGAQMAAARCTQLSRQPHLVVDCSAIVANATKPWHACYYKNSAAGFWRLIDQARWPAVDKTKAHRTREQAEAENDLTNWTGNDLVDEAAKAIALHNDEPEVIGRISAFRTKAAAVLKSLVGIVKAYRKPDLPQTLTARPTETPGRTTTADGHRFVDVEGTDQQICKICCLLKHRLEWNDETCQPHPNIPLLKEQAGKAPLLGHNLRVAVAHPSHCTMIYCTKCGAHATKQARKLAQPCPVLPHQPPNNGQALRSINRGRHPSSKNALLTATFALTQLAAANGLSIPVAQTGQDIPRESSQGGRSALEGPPAFSKAPLAHPQG